MKQFSSIKRLIDLWPTRRVFAAEMGVSVDRVHKWAQTGAIPARYHRRVIVAGSDRGFEISADELVRLHDVSGESAA